MTERGRSFAMLGAAALAAVAVSGCEQRRPDLAEALAPARGHLEDGTGGAASVDELLAAARGRPVSVSFAYVGCSGRTPRLERLRQAEGAVAGGDVFHIVLNVVDGPSRYADVVRDLTGEAPERLDPNALRILFVEKGERWPVEPSAAAEGVMAAMGLRYGRERFIETVSGIGLFDRDGRFAGLRY
ncbi:hypothetical protein [Aureimonas leprariae]|uniref:Lipoprotein n=1 Tax=Plantimonas leprariae TaxID=2615207 RepID=A0A7V7TVL0_9HYPH|nr:hypothetical protein [Aureimonas leprariae]KAB0678117.1 hypothetical protein F6X38_16990 [Aureimonas leprariae]